MTEDKIIDSKVQKDSINGIPNTLIDKLNDEQLQTVLDGNNDAERDKRGAGKLGELIGANTKNASIHIALIICVALMCLCLVDLVHSFFPERQLTSEIWQLIFPVVTLSLGYIFGKGGDK